jgi:predicted HicB family RNase H-like nuclease
LKKFMVVLNDDMHEKLREQAFLCKTSMAELVRTAIKQHLSAEEAKIQKK